MTEADQRNMKQKIHDSFSEMLRVLKKGGEIRLARVLMDGKQGMHLALSWSTDQALKELREKHHMEVERIRMPTNDIYEYDGHRRKTENILAKSYLVVIRKL